MNEGEVIYTDQGGMTEDFRTKVGSKREKAVAASRIGRKILEMGECHKIASDVAEHELKHALKHQGSGHLGVRSNDIFLQGYYEPEGDLGEDEKKQIALAVGEKNMSREDRKHLKKPLFQRILSLLRKR